MKTEFDIAVSFFAPRLINGDGRLGVDEAFVQRAFSGKEHIQIQHFRNFGERPLSDLFLFMGGAGVLIAVSDFIYQLSTDRSLPTLLLFLSGTPALLLMPLKKHFLGDRRVLDCVQRQVDQTCARRQLEI